MPGHGIELRQCLAAANGAESHVTLTVRDVAVDGANSSVLYAATFSGAFKSINGAANWTAINTGISVLRGSARPGAFGVAVDPTDSATVYLTTQSDGGVFKTINGGLTWTPRNSGLTAVQVTALVVHPNSSSVYAATTSNAVYKSMDRGASWLEANLGFTTLVTSSLAIDPITPTTLYAGTRNLPMNDESVFKTIDGSGVFTSTTGGGAWQPTGSVDLLKGAIENLLAEGILTPDQSDGLMGKLDAAISSISRSKTAAACGQLGAFINQVHALVNNGTLSVEVGQALIDPAEAQRSQVGC